MKNKKITLFIALLLTLICGITIGANASSTLQTISAYLNFGITVEYNGTEQVMKDAKGERIYPITYNGSTYLPVRAVADMLGVPVQWNQAAQKVELGTPASGVDFIDNYKPYSAGESFVYVQTVDNKMEPIADESVNHWIRMHFNGTGGYGYFNIGGQYSTLTFKIYSNYDEFINFYGDNNTLLATVPVTANQLPTTHTVNISGTTQLEIAQADRNAQYQNSLDRVYLFDMTLN